MSLADAPILFAFEVPSSDNLTFMPLGVRYHLDHAGLDLSLAGWQQLAWNTRADLARVTPDDSEQGAAEFKAVLAGALGEALSGVEHFTPDARPAWRDRTRVPDDVTRQCTLHDLRVPDVAQWAALADFQRYALAKLSRRDKKNHDFIPAMTEFQLA